MIIRKEIEPSQPLIPSQVEMLHNLKSRPVFPDEDCPEFTIEQLAQHKEPKMRPRTEGK